MLAFDQSALLTGKGDDSGRLSIYVDAVHSVILPSARRHGVADDDMLHAYQHPIRVFDVGGLVMLIGADQAGRLLEIGVATADGLDFVAHAMPARSRFLR